MQILHDLSVSSGWQGKQNEPSSFQKCNCTQLFWRGTVCGRGPWLTMTRDGGAAMDMTHELGQIKEGFLADLLLIDGNPMDDTNILLNRGKTLVVMKDGKFHKAPE